MQKTTEIKKPSITLIRPTDLARELSVPMSTLYRWIEEDPSFPPRIHIGPRTVAFRRDRVISWLESKTEKDQNRPNTIESELKV